MIKVMRLIREIKEFLEDHDLDVKVLKKQVLGIHSILPIALVIRILKKGGISIGIEPQEDLRDAMEEAIESGEDIRSIVDDILSELRDTALELQKMFNNKGYKVVLNLREGESDVRDLLDEVVEEYEEVIEEEFGEEE